MVRVMNTMRIAACDDISLVFSRILSPLGGWGVSFLFRIRYDTGSQQNPALAFRTIRIENLVVVLMC